MIDEKAKCPKCGTEMEYAENFKDPTTEPCPNCGYVPTVSLWRCPKCDHTEDDREPE